MKIVISDGEPFDPSAIADHTYRAQSSPYRSFVFMPKASAMVFFTPFVGAIRFEILFEII